MKRIFLIISFFILIFNNHLTAQSRGEGVFLSANDFKNGKISYRHNKTDTKYKFHLNNISFRSPLKIVTRDTVVKLDKDSIFGYLDKNNICYRYCNKSVYKILNPSGKILLYSNTTIEGWPKNMHRITHYFFSVNASSPVYLLSKSNLRTVLADDTYFQILLDVYFPFDKDLSTYDDINKRYLIERIYELSEQPICKMNHN